MKSNCGGKCNTKMQSSMNAGDDFSHDPQQFVPGSRTMAEKNSSAILHGIENNRRRISRTWNFRCLLRLRKRHSPRQATNTRTHDPAHLQGRKVHVFSKCFFWIFLQSSHFKSFKGPVSFLFFCGAIDTAAESYSALLCVPVKNYSKSKEDAKLDRSSR